jgi:hypothetical protein
MVPIMWSVFCKLQHIFCNGLTRVASIFLAVMCKVHGGCNLMSFTSAYYKDEFFLKHRKKRSSGGSTVLSSDDGRWMSTVICRSNGRYLIRAPSTGRYFL